LSGVNEHMGEGVYIGAAILAGCIAQMKAASKIAWRQRKEEGKNIETESDLRGRAAMIFNGKARTTKGSVRRPGITGDSQSEAGAATADSADGWRDATGCGARQVRPGRPWQSGDRPRRDDTRGRRGKFQATLEQRTRRGRLHRLRGRRAKRRWAGKAQSSQAEAVPHWKSLEPKAEKRGAGRANWANRLVLMLLPFGYPRRRWLCRPPRSRARRPVSSSAACQSPDPIPNRAIDRPLPA
jgi:hypothetical protein